MTQKSKQQIIDSNIAKLVDVILTTDSRKELEAFYQTLPMAERVDLMAYMRTITDKQLFLKVRNLAENLAK
jgi:hypothetical protein